MTQVWLKCKNCEQLKPRELGQHHKRKYCSDKCRQENYRKTRAMSDKSCVDCGEKIPVQNTKFCNVDCQKSWSDKFYAPYQPSIRAIMKARAVGDESIIPKLEEVLRDYIVD